LTFNLLVSKKPLYGIVYGIKGKSTLYKSEIHDISSGNNGDYSAGTGWDAVTKIGTPVVSKLISGN